MAGVSKAEIQDEGMHWEAVVGVTSGKDKGTETRLGKALDIVMLANSYQMLTLLGTTYGDSAYLTYTKIFNCYEVPMKSMPLLCLFARGGN